MKISLVIRCYNEERHIGRLLDGVLQQTEKDVEIIVIDSGSTDNTRSIVSNYPAKLLHIPKEEFSFGRSLNIGCAAATGDIIVIASAHVYPTYMDWLERLVSPFTDPKIAVVYGRQRGDRTTRYSETQVLERWFPKQSNLNQDHPFCNNANAAIRRCLWQQWEYDESLTGLEDTAWANHAMGLKHKVAYVAEAEIVHVHHESLKQIRNRYRREAIAFKGIFPHERFGFPDFIRLFSANVFSDYHHAWRDRVLPGNLTGILGFRLMQFWGTYRGFSQRGPVTSKLRQTFYYPPNSAKPAPAGDEPVPQRLVEYSDLPVEQRLDEGR